MTLDEVKILDYLRGPLEHLGNPISRGGLMEFTNTPPEVLDKVLNNLKSCNFIRKSEEGYIGITMKGLVELAKIEDELNKIE